MRKMFLFAASFWLAAGPIFADVSLENVDSRQTPVSYETNREARNQLNAEIRNLAIPDHYADVWRLALDQRLSDGVPMERPDMDLFLRKISDLAFDFKTANISEGHPTREQLEKMRIATDDLLQDDLDRLGTLKDSLLRTLREIGKDDESPNGFLRVILERAAARFNQDHPEGSAIHEALGGLHVKQGFIREALEDYNQALAQDPNDEEARQGRSEVRYRLGDYSGADQDARVLLSMDPKNAGAIAMLELTKSRLNSSMELGQIQTQTGLAQNAGTNMVEPSLDSPASITLAQTESMQYAKQASAALALRDYPEAVRQATRAVEYNPNNVRAYDYRAISFIQTGRYEAALSSVDQALHVLPKDRVSTNIKAYVLNQSGRYREAKNLLVSSGFGIDTDADASYNLAYAEAGIGNRAAMLDALGRAANLDAARFASIYKLAMETPQDSDLKLLFGEQLAPGMAAAVQNNPDNNYRRFFLILLATLTGGLLMSIGFLHAFAPTWNRGTTRRAPVGGTHADTTREQLVSGTYQIVKQIGYGGMGTVYHAVDINLQRPVALKKMHSEVRQDLRQRQRFLKEARTVAALRHPNIVEIYSIVEEGQELYIVFEYVEGHALHQFISVKGPLNFGQAREVLKSVCRALEYAHSKDVIHRDLKPANIMITRAGIVKVMDFGVARQAKDAMNKLSVTDSIAGTPPYMAPEAEQGITGKESDVYSLGVCLYELLTGDVPFAGIGAGMLLNKMNMNYKPLSLVAKGMPKGIDEFLMRALQPEPARRFRTPAEFLAALEALGHNA